FTRLLGLDLLRRRVLHLFFHHERGESLEQLVTLSRRHLLLAAGGGDRERKRRGERKVEAKGCGPKAPRSGAAKVRHLSACTCRCRLRFARSSRTPACRR